MYRFILILGFLFQSSASGSNLPLLSGALRTFQVHACDGHELRIECWPDTVVSVYLAQYGRRVPSHQLCPPEGVTEGSLDMLNDTTDCVATHALRTMGESCREQRICTIQTSPQTFGSDPCPGVRKYAEVAYKCRPTVFSNKVVCEGDRLKLQCDGRDLRLVIFSASFGATTEGVPECPPQPPDGTAEGCEVVGAGASVVAGCQGRRACSLDSGALGRRGCPPEARLFLKVVHTCVPKEILKDQDLGVSEETKDDSAGFVEEPRYAPPATTPTPSPRTPPTPPGTPDTDNKEKFMLYLTLILSIAVITIVSVLATRWHCRRSRRLREVGEVEAPKKSPLPDSPPGGAGGISPFGGAPDPFEEPPGGVEIVMFTPRSSFKKALPIEEDDCSFPRAPVAAHNNYYYS